MVENRDRIRLNANERRLDLLISESEMRNRLRSWSPPTTEHLRGYPRLYIDHVLQADEGCDFDFLRPASKLAARFVLPIVGRS